MKIVTGLKFAAFLAVVAGMSVAFQAGRVLAQEATTNKAAQPAQTQEQKNAPAAKPSEAPKTATYSYVAQPGDSYAKMARKAIQTYGKKYKVNLTLAGIIYGETHMTQEAGSPLLQMGQNVSIDESKVAQWVEQAKNLTDAQQAAWNYYVQFADFDTNNVGEVR